MHDSMKNYRNDLEKKYQNLIEVNPQLNRQLVSFQANKKVPFYGWFPYKEGFSSKMVKIFIQNYSKNNGKNVSIFDPFAGTGTTLFSSREMGFNSIGIELLPIGEFIFNSRKAAEKLDNNNFIQVVNNLKKIDFQRLSTDDDHNFKHVVITKNAFPAETEKKLNGFIKYIDEEIEDKYIEQILRFVCFCILEKISYTRKDGQYLRWDNRAGKRKSKFEKAKIFSFEEALFDKLNQIISDINTFNFDNKDEISNDIEIKLNKGTCLEIMPKLDAESFDLIISSPPYCNRYDYTRTYALELVFLGMGNEEIKKLRQNLLSCTVENKEKIQLLKDIYKNNHQIEIFNKAENAFFSNNALQEILSILEDYKNQGKLNNAGIYRMVKNYFYEHSFVIFEMARLLKKGGRIYYVNDNVRYAGEIIPVDLILSEFAEAAGLTVKKIYKLPVGKGNSSQQMGIHGREELRKCVYYWEK